MKTILLAIVATASSGCASAPEQWNPQTLTNAIGTRFSGQPVEQIIARYGAPTRQIEIRGETIYTWERTNVMTFQTRPDVRVGCQLDAYVTQAGIVRTIGLNGQNGACPQFAP